MRPLLGDGRPRPSHTDDFMPAAASSSNHMSFVLTDEASLDSYLESRSNHQHPPIRFRDTSKGPDFSFSLPSVSCVDSEDTFEDDDCISTATTDERDDEDGDESGRIEPVFPSPRTNRHTEDDNRPTLGPSPPSLSTQSPVSLQSHTQASFSRPISPIMLGTSCAESLISAPSSRRGSLSGSNSEHPRSPVGHTSPERLGPSPQFDGANFPQLVMPCITMPSRRPFTDTGKRLGRLKLLLAGDSGVGKTSLIQAIVQTCEHIVHVEPILPESQPGTRSVDKKSAPASSRKASQTKPDISEIFASTKSYPEWWSELDMSRSSQRRKSFGDTVLERNICFVDTPGYASGSSAMETIMPCVEYIESHLSRISSDDLSDSETLNMLGGNGGFQVDAVLYLISRDVKPVDLEYLRRLAPLTNIIPILAKADTLTPEQLVASKRRIAGRLQAAGVKYFDFSLHAGTHDTGAAIPFAVSSASGSDHEIMDASLLMSPDYVQPLVPTELNVLLDRIFSIDGASWLRYAAARKYMQWKDSSLTKPRHLYRPLDVPREADSLALVRASDKKRGGSSSMTLARTHGRHQTDNPPQIRVAEWATSLQRSLASEQAKHETMFRGDGGIYFTKASHRRARDGTLVQVRGLKEVAMTDNRVVSRKTGSRYTEQHQDPLGLIQVAANFKAKSWVALELLGGLGVIGGIAVYLTRRNMHIDPTGLDLTWA